MSTVHTDKSKVEISQNFVAFSESTKLNVSSHALFCFTYAWQKKKRKKIVLINSFFFSVYTKEMWKSCE